MSKIAALNVRTTYVPTGEFRPPKRGEWYCLGAVVERGEFPAYFLAGAHHTTPQHIAMRVDEHMEPPADWMTRAYRMFKASTPYDTREFLDFIEAIQRVAPLTPDPRDEQVTSVTFVPTGEIRSPKRGEWFKDQGVFTNTYFDFQNTRRPIYTRTETTSPRPPAWIKQAADDFCSRQRIQPNSAELSTRFCAAIDAHRPRAGGIESAGKFILAYVLT